MGKAENSIHFYLEEYRKPEFKVTITPEKPFFINGETMNFLVQSEYYFGAPVVNANARYRIYESVASGGYQRSFPSSYNRYLSGGEVTTDAEGIARIKFTPRRSSVDRQISVEVEVTEASGRSVTSQGSAPVGVGEFYITARPKKHVYGPEDQLAIEIQTRNHEDKPVSVELTVEYTQDVWNPVRQRYVRPSRPFASVTVKTDEKGKALAEWLPDTKEVNGSVEVVIIGKDERGNTITGSSSCWRMMSRSGSFHYQYPTLEGIFDNDSYQPGEEAALLIQTQYPENPVILTIEGRDIHSYQVIWPAGKSTQVNIPILESYSPNVYVGLFMPRGIYLSNRIYTLSVPIERGAMNIELTADKEKYKPGETGTVKIKTTLPDGAPTPAEVSLAVVDEAIFALRHDHTPAIHRVFYGNQTNWVTTSYSFPMQYYGGANKGVKPDIRKDFRDTAEWIANVYTDENGESTVKVRYPDNLTTWRLTSRGHTKNTDVGWTKSTTLVNKELAARLSLPRFFVENDTLKLPTLVNNLTEKNLPEIKTKLQITGGVELMEDDEKVTRAAAGALARELWNLKVNAASPEAVFVFEAIGEEDADALQLSAPVLAEGYREEKRLSQRLSETSATLQLNLEDNVLLDRSKFMVTITPSLAAVAMGAIPYLDRFPYGCCEQTLNGFLPSIVLMDALEECGLKKFTSDEKEQIQQKAKAGIARLSVMQNGDGGWGWFYGDSRPYPSALVLNGLVIADNLGYPVQDWRIEQGTRYLKRAAHETRDWDTQAYILYVLSTIEEERHELLPELHANMNELFDFGLAVGSAVTFRAGELEKAKEMKERLLSRLVSINESEAAWEVEPSRFWTWNGSAQETTAWGLISLIEQDGPSPLTDQIAQWLVRQRDGSRWRSTRATGLIVQALGSVIRAEKELQQLGPLDYTIRVNDEVLQSGTMKPEELSQPLTVSIDPQKMKQGDNALTLEANRASGFWSLDASLFHHGEIVVPIPHESVALNRVYERAIHTKDYRGRPKILTEGFSPTEELDVGQEILVTLVLEAKQDLPYMIVEEPLPSGCEVVESFLKQVTQGWSPYTHYERRDEKMVFFLEQVPKGETRIEYLIRTELSGSFRANPAYAWCMYYPEYSARSATTKLSVK